MLSVLLELPLKTQTTQIASNFQESWKGENVQVSQKVFQKLACISKEETEKMMQSFKKESLSSLSPRQRTNTKK